MRTRVKTKNFVITWAIAFVLLCLSAFSVLSVGASVAKGDTVRLEGEDYNANVLKFTLNVSEEYRKGGAKQGSEMYANYSILNWMEGTPALYEGGKLTYDVFSPTPIAGIGGVSGQYTGTGDNANMMLHKKFEENGIKDALGFSASAKADLSDVIANGWYSRTINLPRSIAGTAIEPFRIGHISIPLHITSGTIIDYPAVEVYYRNIKLVSPGGTEVPLITSSTSVSGGFKLGSDFLPAGESYENSGAEKLWAELSSPKNKPIPKINAAGIIRAGYINEPIDFSHTEYDNKGAGYTASLTVNGVLNDGLSVIHLVGGSFNLVFKVEDTVNGMHTLVKKEIQVLENKNSVYFFSADKIAIDKHLTAIPSEMITIPFVYGFLDGDVKATLTVSDSDDINYAVTEKDGNYTVTLGNQDNDYLFEFSAAKNGKTGSFNKAYSAKFPAEPMIDDTTIPTSATSGAFVNLSGVSATDYQDGALTPTITITDPFGDKVTIVDGGFYAAVAGKYTISVKATDKENHAVEKSFEFISVKTVGQVIQWRVNVPEAMRGAGILKAGRKSIYGFIEAAPYKFKKGDVLSYEVYSPSGLKGLGVIDGQHDGGSGAWNTFKVNGWYEAKDANGIAMGFDGDISLKAKDSWYYRQSEITEGMAQDGSVRHFALSFSTTDAIEGEYFDVYYRNIKVVSLDGSQHDFYSGLHQIKQLNLPGGDISGLSDVSSKMFSIMNPFFTIDIGKFLPEYRTSDNNILPTYMLNYKTGEKIDKTIITATDEANRTVTLVGGKLPDNMVGEITIKYQNIAGEAVTFSEEIKISVLDTSAPTIKTKDGAVSFKAKKGSTFTLPELSCLDNYDAATRIKTSVEVILPDGKKMTLGKDEKSFNLESKGTYKVIITARDAGRNESTLELTVEVASDSTPIIILLLVGGVILMGGAATAVILVRKKKKKAA